jgi:hypothetical protein
MRTLCESQIQVKNTDHSLKQRKSMLGAITGDIIGSRFEGPPGRCAGLSLT